MEDGAGEKLSCNENKDFVVRLQIVLFDVDSPSELQALDDANARIGRLRHT